MEINLNEPSIQIDGNFIAVRKEIASGAEEI